MVMLSAFYMVYDVTYLFRF